MTGSEDRCKVGVCPTTDQLISDLVDNLYHINTTEYQLNSFQQYTRASKLHNPITFSWWKLVVKSQLTSQLNQLLKYASDQS